MVLLMFCTQSVSKFGKLSSGHRTGKNHFSFQSQRRVMPKNVWLQQNCTHPTSQQSNAQNPSGYDSAVYELRTFRYTSQIQKTQKNKRSSCQYPLDLQRARKFRRGVYVCVCVCVCVYMYVYICIYISASLITRKLLIV